jgi:hypothetical protein
LEEIESNAEERPEFACRLVGNAGVSVKMCMSDPWSVMLSRSGERKWIGELVGDFEVGKG